MKSIFIGDKSTSLEKWAKQGNLDVDMVRCILKSIEEPDETPYLLERITKDFRKVSRRSRSEIRSALLRVQIDCSINSNADPIKISKQLFIAQVLEKLLFGSNLLMGDEILVEERPVRKKGKKGK